MLKRLRTAHPLVFCVLAEVVFLASLFVMPDEKIFFIDSGN